MSLLRPVWAQIDLSAIAANVEALSDLLQPPTLLMAVVKANGYGHGAVQVARVALSSGAQRLGVAILDEALELRSAAIGAPIQLFQETPAQAARQVVDADLIPTVVSFELAQALSAAAVERGKTVKVHVKVDTGMHRLGIPPEQAVGFVAACRELAGLEVEGVYTHFAVAECPHGEATVLQKQTFDEVLAALENEGILPPLRHAANSAATILTPESHYDMVRCGIAVYGLHPADTTRDAVSLRPALSLRARISALRRIEAGEGVSYGHTFKAEGPTRIATVPIGYADGYTRRLSNKASVLVDGRELPVVGNICMDQLLVDAGEAEVAVDDEVTLIGKSGRRAVTADEIARLTGTINYEVVCAISPRVPRLYT